MGAPGQPGPGPHHAVVDAALDGLDDQMVAVRRDIHAHPEVAWREVRTSALVAEVLTGAGLTTTGLPSGTGLVCDVIGEPDGPMVALRADLDALPIDDEKTVPYRSSVPGVAHACGHDVHTAVVLGAGLALARLAGRGELAGRVRLVF
jgi:amidohydrolase